MKTPSAECGHCGVSLPPAHPGRGRQKQFCTDNCRVKAGYRRKYGVTTNRERLLRIAGDYEPASMTEPQKAWLAAMVDGEGFISINHHKNDRDDRGSFFPVIGVCNSNKLLLQEVRGIVGQGYTMVRWRRAHQNQKAVGTVTIGRVAMQDVLLAILPYMIAKRRQAELAIEFCRIHDDLPVRTQPLEQFATMHREARLLNKRGVEDT